MELKEGKAPTTGTIGFWFRNTQVEDNTWWIHCTRHKQHHYFHFPLQPISVFGGKALAEPSSSFGWVIGFA